MGSIQSVVFSPDGSTVASGDAWGDSTVRLWDARSGELKRKLEPDTKHGFRGGDVNSVAFSPDGVTLASGSDDRTISLWNARTGEITYTLEGHTHSVSSVAFSPDGSTVVSGGYWEDNTVRLWDPRTGEHEQTLEGHTNAVLTVAVSPDGLTIASGSRDKTIRLWDAHTGDHKQTLEGHTRDVWCVAFSPDGGTLVSGSEDHTIRLWDARTGDLVQTLDDPTHGVLSVAFSPDGYMLASGGGWRDNAVRLWNLRTGTVLHTFEGHTDRLWAVAFSPDGSTVASGSWDGTILLWNITAYRNLVQAMAADVNHDGTVNILDLVLVAAHFGQRGLNRADINRDGVVNLLDLELVAWAFGNAAASPPSRAAGLGSLTAEDVREWLAEAKRLETTDSTVQNGIITLKRLVSALTANSTIPTETALLPNYPNPFNPETWIPYQLKTPADVTLTVHNVDGETVQTLEIGYQPAGLYQSRDRAAYWDGRNQYGESVATGIYFCTLTAGDFTATRRMPVNK